MTNEFYLGFNEEKKILALYPDEPTGNLDDYVAVQLEDKHPCHVTRDSQELVSIPLPVGHSQVADCITGILIADGVLKGTERTEIGNGSGNPHIWTLKSGYSTLKLRDRILKSIYDC